MSVNVYQELAALGYCPAKKFGYMKQVPTDFRFPRYCSHEIFLKMPLHLQVFYSVDSINGRHKLVHGKAKD